MVVIQREFYQAASGFVMEQKVNKGTYKLGRWTYIYLGQMGAVLTMNPQLLFPPAEWICSSVVLHFCTENEETQFCLKTKKKD